MLFLIGVIGVICGFSLPVFADTWSQTTFTSGTFTNTTTTTNSADVILSKNAIWANQNPAGPPATRYNHALAYDSTNKKVVLFGGWSGGYLNDTWVYDTAANTWTNMNPAGPPATRRYHALAYDSANNKVVLFGGFNGVVYFNDTWVYDTAANTWTNMNPASPPATRIYPALAYNSTNKKVVLFGGNNGAYLNDTWVYDVAANTWTNQNPAGPPAGREAPALAYDSANNKVVLFGGWNGGYLNDTWVYDVAANTWTNMNPAVPPAARAYHALAYDSFNKKVVLFDGWNGGYLNDTWVYDVAANTWTNMNPAVPPAARAYHALAYDFFNKKVVLFGGAGAANYNDTWTYASSYFASGTYLSDPITPAGVSCWSRLTYTKTTPANTLLTVDVLSASNNALLVANVPSGTNLQAAYPATFTNITGIKLQANLSTTDGTVTPLLADWQVEYGIGNPVNTANWTSIVKAANPVAMGNAVAVISFTAVAAGTITTAHWRRFRIDETGGQPVEKLSVSVYEESGNDGFFDAADKFIASGTFNSNRTCYLNMNRWPLGTTPKTYYIVEKVALDGSGGQTIRLNIVDGSYFDFEEGPCVGVPP